MSGEGDKWAGGDVLWLPVVLTELHTGRTCGMAVIPMKDGKAQIDLIAMGFQIAPEMEIGASAIMSVIITDPTELIRLPHYVYWTKLYDPLAERIQAVDLARVTDQMVQ